MSHFAEIGKNGEVIRVIVAEQEFIDSGAVGDPSRWVQTSYNGSIRKRYAGKGYFYDKELDAFIPPKPFKSWSLDEKTLDWVPPKEKPQHLPNRRVVWDELRKDWYEVGDDSSSPLL